ncbi:MAG: HNH endonuclease [Succinivibrio sp.]|nr:HNH endonuclease [Succinivibrio sp.]
MSRKSLTERDLKALWGLNAAYCQLCGCKIVSVDSAGKIEIIGETAHIAAHSPGGKRYNELPEGMDRDGPDNLILLCPNCHRKVDQDAEKYPAQELYRLKKERQQLVSEAIEKGRNEFADRDLMAAIDEIRVQLSVNDRREDLDYRPDFSMIPSAEKMTKNDLSPQVKRDLIHGLERGRDVAEYFRKNGILSGGRADDLKLGFQRCYRQLKQAGVGGDGVFFALRDCVVSKDASYEENGRRQAAAEAVIAQLFVMCELFER